MQELYEDSLLEINGGGISIDFGTINPWDIGKEFGEHVVYPYIWKPLKNLFS